MSSATVDARYLLCPHPVIRTRDAVADCRPGDNLQVVCTDPAVMHDIRVWCRIHGYEVCSIERSDNEIMIEIEVGETD